MKSTMVASQSELEVVAKSLIEFAGEEKFFIFEGDMGAGKTTFIKSLCAVLGVKDNVSSPTFSIINEYDSPNGTIFHFDCYRMKNLQEAFDIGYEEYFYSGLYCLVEWPSKVEELLPDSYIKVEIEPVSEMLREFSFTKIVN